MKRNKKRSSSLSYKISNNDNSGRMYHPSDIKKVSDEMIPKPLVIVAYTIFIMAIATALLSILSQIIRKKLVSNWLVMVLTILSIPTYTLIIHYYLKAKSKINRMKMSTQELSDSASQARKR